MSASMAEVLREALRDHRVAWETTHDDEVLLARCKSCGYLSVELETWEHQANVAAEVLAANGYGKLEDAWGEGYTTGNAHNGRRDATPYRQDADK